MRTASKDNNLPENSIVLLYGVFDSKTLALLKKKKVKDVFILEGRPDFTSSRHTARELNKLKIKPTLIADNMAGFLFHRGLVKEVWLSYQLLDPKGALCLIGSLILAVLGKAHRVPVRLFPTEKASKLVGKEKDIFYFNKQKVAPKNIRGYVPLVEWVPDNYLMRSYE